MKKRKPVMSVTESQLQEDRLPGVTDGRQELRELLARTKLSSSEEKVIRMHHGLVIDDERPLEQKTNDPLLLEQLAEIELIAFRQLTRAAENAVRPRSVLRQQDER